jgi:aryl-alcohol dehydrogenase-like predicted oxidoreductase
MLWFRGKCILNRLGKVTNTIQEALKYNMSPPVSTTIIGVNNVAQIEEDVRIASKSLRSLKSK